MALEYADAQQLLVVPADGNLCQGSSLCSGRRDVPTSKDAREVIENK